MTINGVNVPSPQSSVRQIKLDVVPANLVDSVEISKTLSANQDGDAIGGSVNLVTKTAGDQPTLYLNGIGGYTPILGGRTLYESDGSVGKRFGTTKRLGILVGGSYDWNGRGIDDVEPSLDTLNGQAIVPSIDLREYRYYRSRYGTAGTLDYKLGDASGVYARFLYSHFNNFGDRWDYAPSTGFISPTQGDGSGNVSFGAQQRRPVEVIGSLQAGGRHTFSHWWLAYDAAVSRSASADKGYFSSSFNGPTGSTFNLDRSNPLEPKLTTAKGFNIYDPSAYSLASVDVSHSYSPQLNLQAAASGARSYSARGHLGTLEFGAKFRNAHKFEDAVDDYFNADGPNAGGNSSALLLTNFLSTFHNPDYYSGAYQLGPLTNNNAIRDFFYTNQAGYFTPDLASTQQNTYPNDYDLIERVTAGYVMNTIDLGSVRLQTGLRFEGTNENLRGNQVLFDTNGLVTSVNPIAREQSYIDVLPSVQLRYGLPHDAAIRAAFSRSLARPNYSDLPPTFSANGAANEVDVGNPNLNPTHANNYDLLLEEYLKPLGLLQAGFFYKQISDPIYSGRSVITSAQQFGAQYVGYDLVEPINGSSGHLAGFEAAYQQRLTFLPGALRALGISANYSYTTSQVDSVPFRTDSPPLQRQAPNTWNVSPTYDKGRLSIRVGISHNDANIFQYNFSNIDPATGKPVVVPLGLHGPNGDVYLYSHTQVDAQGSFRMYRGLQLIVAGLNLNNEVFGFYQGGTQYPIQREFYQPSYQFGLRYTLTNEPK